MGRNYMKVSYEDFVVAWCTERSVERVSEVTNLPVSVCKSRAVQLRGRGVKLPKMRPTSKLSDPLFISQLNSLVNKYKKVNA